MILLLPGASATGRDFLLEQILGNPQVVGERLGLGRPVKIGVVKKTTTRPSRSIEFLKICVDDQTFKQGIDAGLILAPYVLESNGHWYGYHRSSFDSAEESDVLVSDASVYQIPALKQEFGAQLFTSAMIATRQYRYENLLARGSENQEEMTDRLNLGDAHVVLAILMANEPGVDYHDFVPAEFANMVDGLIAGTKNQIDTQFEQTIEAYSKSRAVVDMIKQFAKAPAKYVDHLAILGDEHRLPAGIPVTETKFFGLGVDILQKVITN